MYAKEAEKEKTESITVKQWVKARQQHLFSLKEQEKVRQSLLNAGASGSEQKESETVVGGIKVSRRSFLASVRADADRLLPQPLNQVKYWN